MEKIQRLLFDAQECGSFVYSAIHGLSNGRADCDGKTIYLNGGVNRWMQSEKPFPVPFFMNFINLNKNDKKRATLRLPQILQEDSERVQQYLRTLVPFFAFTQSGDSYLVGQEGLIVKPTKEIVSPSQVALDSSPVWFNDDIREKIDMDTYNAVSKANHQRFFKRFCPWYFEQNPKYAQLTHSEKSLVEKYAQHVRNEKPVSSRELSALI